MPYHHLGFAQRCEISALHQQGIPVVQIAAALGVHKTTIYNELKRNAAKWGAPLGYQPEYAQGQAQQRRRAARPACSAYTTSLIPAIVIGLKADFSPEQITGRRKKEGLPTLSHETIYQHIYRDQAAGGQLFKYLRTRKRKRKKRSRIEPKITPYGQRLRIQQRPAEVELKQRRGDWEGDTIIGANHQGAILTLVDRNTKYLCAKRLNTRDAASTATAILHCLKHQTAHTLTTDNGLEFAHFERVSKQLNISFYFADPYASWQRGLNENTNRLLRQYIPKKTDFRTITPKRLAQIVTKLNNRPRKTLGFRTPAEVNFANSDPTTQSTTQHILNWAFPIQITVKNPP